MNGIDHEKETEIIGGSDGQFRRKIDASYGASGKSGLRFYSRKSLQIHIDAPTGFIMIEVCMSLS